MRAPRRFAGPSQSAHPEYPVAESAATSVQRPRLLLASGSRARYRPLARYRSSGGCAVHARLPIHRAWPNDCRSVVLRQYQGHWRRPRRARPPRVVRRQEFARHTCRAHRGVVAGLGPTRLLGLHLFPCFQHQLPQRHLRHASPCRQRTRPQWMALAWSRAAQSVPARRQGLGPQVPGSRDLGRISSAHGAGLAWPRAAAWHRGWYRSRNRRCTNLAPCPSPLGVPTPPHRGWVDRVRVHKPWR